MIFMSMENRNPPEQLTGRKRARMGANVEPTVFPYGAPGDQVDGTLCGIPRGYREMRLRDCDSAHDA
jgi:hypothetical protein